MNVTMESERANGIRTMPKVPGLNAQPLAPSIGTDHWVLSRTAKRMRSAQLRQARPFAGSTDPWLVPGTPSKRRKRDTMCDRPTSTPARKPKWAK